MNTRAFTLALVISVIAMWMVHTYIEGQKSIVLKKFGTEGTVVVAKVDINELELIDDSKVTIRTIPKSYQAPGHFKKIEDVANTVATMPILKGEQITKPRVTYPGAKTGLARQVSAGKRAIALKIREHEAVSKLIKPGDRVDILAAVDYASGVGHLQRVNTVLQDILVLSTGLNLTNSIPIIGVKTPNIIRKMNLNTYSRYNTITLELDPYQAQKLVYIVTFSKEPFYLTLRNNNDSKKIRIGPTKIFDLLGEGAAEAKEYYRKKYAGKK